MCFFCICCSAFALVQNCCVTSCPTSPTSYFSETRMAFYFWCTTTCLKNPRHCVATHPHPPKRRFIVSVFHQWVKYQKEPGRVSHSLWVNDKKGMLWLHRAINTLRCAAKCWKPPFYLASTTSIQLYSYTKSWEIAKMRNVLNVSCNLFCLNLFIFKLSPKNCTYINECSPFIGLCIQNSPRNVSNPHQVFMDVIFAFRWELYKITHCHTISC